MILRNVISKSRWELISTSDEIVEFRPIMNSTSIFVGDVNSSSNLLIFNDIYVKNYNKDIFGMLNHTGHGDELLFHHGSSQIKLCYPGDIGDDVQFVLKEHGWHDPFELKSKEFSIEHIELIRYADFINEADKISKTSMDHQELNDNLKASMSRVNKLKVKDDTYFWAITYGKKT